MKRLIALLLFLCLSISLLVPLGVGATQPDEDPPAIYTMTQVSTAPGIVLRGEVKRVPKIASDGVTRYLSPLYAGDEPFMLARNLDNVAVLVDKDRVKSGIFAIEQQIGRASCRERV